MASHSVTPGPCALFQNCHVKMHTNPEIHLGVDQCFAHMLRFQNQFLVYLCLINSTGEAFDMVDLYILNLD